MMTVAERDLLHLRIYQMLALGYRVDDLDIPEEAAGMAVEIADDVQAIRDKGMCPAPLDEHDGTALLLPLRGVADEDQPAAVFRKVLHGRP